MYLYVRRRIFVCKSACTRLRAGACDMCQSMHASMFVTYVGTLVCASRHVRAYGHFSICVLWQAAYDLNFCLLWKNFCESDPCRNAAYY